MSQTQTTPKIRDSSPSYTCHDDTPVSPDKRDIDEPIDLCQNLLDQNILINPIFPDKDLTISVEKHDETLEETEQRILREKNKRLEIIAKLGAKIEKLKSQRQKQIEYNKSKEIHELNQIEKITQLVDILKENKDNDLQERDQFIQVLTLKTEVLAHQIGLMNENHEKQYEKLIKRTQVIDQIQDTLNNCISKPRKADSFCHEIYSTARQQTLYIEHLSEVIANITDQIESLESKILNFQHAIQTVIEESENCDKTILCLNKCNYDIDEALDNMGEGDSTHREIEEKGVA